MTPRVFNTNGVELNLGWARQKYGVEFVDAGNVKKFALTEIRETTGKAIVSILVLNEAGGPQYSHPVAEYWPDPDLQSLVQSGWKTLLQRRALVLKTGANGVVDFAFGAGGVIHDIASGGPFTVWVGSPTLPSDGLARIGWLGGTDHDGMHHLVFRINTPDVVEPEPPPVEPPDDEGPPDTDPELTRWCENVIGLLSGQYDELKAIWQELRAIAQHIGVK